jgi:hypothetical protein
VVSSDPPSTDGLAQSLSGLRDAAEEAALRLSADDNDADLEELAQTLARLESRGAELAKSARGAWKARLAEALRHFHEARDLLDDGEPADAVALEVMAGREVLRN